MAHSYSKNEDHTVGDDQVHSDEKPVNEAEYFKNGGNSSFASCQVDELAEGKNLAPVTDIQRSSGVSGETTRKAVGTQTTSALLQNEATEHSLERTPEDETTTHAGPNMPDPTTQRKVHSKSNECKESNDKIQSPTSPALKKFNCIGKDSLALGPPTKQTHTDANVTLPRPGNTQTNERRAGPEEHIDASPMQQLNINEAEDIGHRGNTQQQTSVKVDCQSSGSNINKGKARQSPRKVRRKKVPKSKSSLQPDARHDARNTKPGGGAKHAQMENYQLLKRKEGSTRFSEGAAHRQAIPRLEIPRHVYDQSDSTARLEGLGANAQMKSFKQQSQSRGRHDSVRRTGSSGEINRHLQIQEPAPVETTDSPAEIVTPNNEKQAEGMLEQSKRKKKTRPNRHIRARRRMKEMPSNHSRQVNDNKKQCLTNDDDEMRSVEHPTIYSDASGFKAYDKETKMPNSDDVTREEKREVEASSPQEELGADPFSQRDRVETQTGQLPTLNSLQTSQVSPYVSPQTREAELHGPRTGGRTFTHEPVEGDLNTRDRRETNLVSQTTNHSIELLGAAMVNISQIERNGVEDITLSFHSSRILPMLRFAERQVAQADRPTEVTVREDSDCISKAF